VTTRPIVDRPSAMHQAWSRLKLGAPMALAPIAPRGRTGDDMLEAAAGSRGVRLVSQELRPQEHLFVDHSQFVQFGCLWERVFTYPGE
jgi:hypothetical protein